MIKMTATITCLRDAAAAMNRAANELESQGSYHHESALCNINLAIKDGELCKRQINRELDKRVEVLNSYHKKQEAAWEV